MVKKILIIDDEKSLVSALADKFIQAGLSVMSATNGRDGLNMAFENRPDLILLDILMPIMDGITMLDELRKDKWGKNAKVILLTNLADTKKISKPIIKNVSGCLVKTDWKLEDIVKQVIEKLAD